MQDFINFKNLKKAVDNSMPKVLKGMVTRVSGLSAEAELAGARIGMTAKIFSRGNEPVEMEVAKVDGSIAKLIPLNSMPGIGPGDKVVTSFSRSEIPCGYGLMGKIIDPLGNVQGGESPGNLKSWPTNRKPPEPLKIKPINSQFVTGIRAIDSLLTIGKGQRMGLFAGPGLGKTTLLGQIAANSRCDVCVLCLAGERGAEVMDFITQISRLDGFSRSVVVLADASSPPMMKVKALSTATAVAEWFRNDGKDVLLVVDSLTRIIRAKRDVALALGEEPGPGGFPVSSFSFLPQLVERTGMDSKGASITAIYAVLTEADENDPLQREVKSLIDGHIVLSKKLADAGKWPAIDILQSISRIMKTIGNSDDLKNAVLIRSLLSAYENLEDLIMMGAYKTGSSLETDLAIKYKGELEDFLFQDISCFESMDDTKKELEKLVKKIFFTNFRKKA